jgi:hypothetical protein
MMLARTLRDPASPNLAVSCGRSGKLGSALGDGSRFGTGSVRGCDTGTGTPPNRFERSIRLERMVI